ncbi:MAG: outer membrane protein assembly factor BamA [Candidatus Omnitrophica bacterium]|nr:outer membrane protein assembly factor BamA [Candidatus Omnitrophota bacterium]
MRYLKLFIFSISLILAASCCAFAQESVQNSSPEQAVAAELPAKTVTAIEVIGNKSTSTNTILSKMKTHIGSPYQENVISDDLKRLFLLGFFSDIKIDTEDYKDGLKVIVRVTERPIIETISFAGITRIRMKEEKLKEELKSKEKQYLDYPNLAEDVQKLKKMYEKIGFSQVQINYQVDVNKTTNKAKVQFNVVEGQKIRVKHIDFEGNTAFSDKKLLKLIKTRWAWLFNAGVLKDEVLKEDVDRIKSFYRRQGYADVAVDSEVKQDSKKPYLLYVVIRVQEGKKYLVGNVSIQGNKEISEKQIISKLSEAIPGKVYSEEAMKFDVAGIQSLYFDRGYISCQVQEATSLNSSSGRVDITYTITENEIAYVDKIKIRGNIKTKDIVIRRELKIAPGDKFDGDKLRRSKEKLANLGFFDEISYDTEDTKEPDKKDLIVDVKESKTGAFSFGGGYSTVDQFVGFVEVEQKNFDWRNWPYFTGGGQNIKLRASFGSITQYYDLSFTNPWIFDYPVSFGFDTYKREHKRDTDVGYGYDESVLGGDLRLGYQLTDYIKTDLTYRCDQIKISNISSNATNDLMQEQGKNTISSIMPAVVFDTRDNVFDPHKGNLLTSSVEFAGGPLSGNKDYWKYYGSASHYIPLAWNSVIEVKGRAGVGAPYDDTARIPIYERFFAGGAYTIRGYEERKVGPIDPVSRDPLGGDAMLIGNLEYTYPLFSFLKLAAFYDVGNVWESKKDFGKDGYKSGIGFGVRVKTPLGPIRLDYGFPMNKEPGDDEIKGGRLHFSASHDF